MPPLTAMFDVDLGRDANVLPGLILVQEMVTALRLVVRGFDHPDPAQSPQPA